MNHSVIWDAVRQAVRQHIPTAAVAALFVAYGVGAYLHTTALGMADQAAADTTTTLQWAIVSVLAIALGVLTATPSRIDPLLVARGAHPFTLFAQRLAGAAGIVCGVCSVATLMALASGWMPTNQALWVGIGVTLQSLVTLCMTSWLRRLLAPAWAGFVALCLWWVAHLADETLALAAEGRAWAPWVYTVLPDLDRLNGATWVGADVAIIGLSMGSGVMWCALFVAGALWTLRR